MTSNQKAMYTGLAMCRNTEAQMRWYRINFFLLLHSAGLSILAARADKWTFQLLFWTSIVGMILGFVWAATIWILNYETPISVILADAGI